LHQPLNMHKRSIGRHEQKKLRNQLWSPFQKSSRVICSVYTKCQRIPEFLSFAQVSKIIHSCHIYWVQSAIRGGRIISFGIRLHPIKSNLKLYAKFRYVIKVEEYGIENDVIPFEGVITPEEFKDGRISIDFQYNMNDDPLCQCTELEGLKETVNTETHMRKTFKIFFFGQESNYVLERSHTFLISKEMSQNHHERQNRTELEFNFEDLGQDCGEIAKDLETLSLETSSEGPSIIEEQEQ